MKGHKNEAGYKNDCKRKQSKKELLYFYTQNYSSPTT